MLPIFMVIENADERLLAEQLYLTYKNRMYNLAFSILNNREDAEDTVMDSIYKIVKNISLFMNADRNKTESLIVIIVRNTAINRYRYNKRHGCVSADEFGDTFPDDEPTAPELVIEEEAFNTLVNKIHTLDPIYRDVLLLKYLYEYNNTTVASITGVAEVTVRVRLMRARAMLLKLLKGGNGNEG